MTKPTQPTSNKQAKPAATMRTWQMELVLGAVASAVVYLAGSLAIDTGSLWTYAIAVIFLVVGIRHFYNAIQTYAKRKANDGHER